MFPFLLIAPNVACLWVYDPPVIPLAFFQFYTVVQWKIEKLGSFGLRYFSKIDFPDFFPIIKILQILL